MRFSISTTVRFTPRRTSASRMMQPMKPAPISSTGAPRCARPRMWRASSSVQHGMHAWQIDSRYRRHSRMGSGSDQELVVVQRPRPREDEHLRAAVDALHPVPNDVDSTVFVVVILLAQVGAGLVDVVGQQVRNGHARVRRLRLVADDRHSRCAVGLAQRLRRDDAGGARSDDHVMHVSAPLKSRTQDCGSTRAGRDRRPARGTAPLGRQSLNRSSVSFEGTPSGVQPRIS